MSQRVWGGLLLAAGLVSSVATSGGAEEPIAIGIDEVRDTGADTACEALSTLCLQVDGGELSAIEVFDAEEALVAQESFEPAETEWCSDPLAAGIYLVIAESSLGTLSEEVTLACDDAAVVLSP